MHYHADLEWVRTAFRNFSRTVVNPKTPAANLERVGNQSRQERRGNCRGDFQSWHPEDSASRLPPAAPSEDLRRRGLIPLEVSACCPAQASAASHHPDFVTHCAE